MSPTLRRASYKRLGRYRPAAALLLPNAPADLKSWLTDRLGAIEWLKIEEVELSPKASEPPTPADAPAPAAPTSCPLLRAADYDAGLAARYRCVVNIPADPTRPAPIKAEIVRFDPAAGIAWPPFAHAILARVKAAEVRAAAPREVSTSRRSRQSSEAVA